MSPANPDWCAEVRIKDAALEFRQSEQRKWAVETWTPNSDRWIVTLYLNIYICILYMKILY